MGEIIPILFNQYCVLEISDFNSNVKFEAMLKRNWKLLYLNSLFVVVFLVNKAPTI